PADHPDPGRARFRHPGRDRIAPPELPARAGARGAGGPLVQPGGEPRPGVLVLPPPGLVDPRPDAARPRVPRRPSRGARLRPGELRRLARGEGRPALRGGMGALGAVGPADAPARRRGLAAVPAGPDARAMPVPGGATPPGLVELVAADLDPPAHAGVGMPRPRRGPGGDRDPSRGAGAECLPHGPAD